MNETPQLPMNANILHMQAVMTDCVIAEDGYSYERSAITAWLLHNKASPVTGKPLQHLRLLPNVWLKQAIKMHKDSCGGA